MPDKKTDSNPPILWLIDDDPALRLILEDNFSNAGIQVISFTNAHGAWIQLNDVLEKQKSNQAKSNQAESNRQPTGYDADDDSIQLPHAILTDIRMPLMDGLSFSDWLHKSFPDIPVIIMTAHSDLQAAIDSYQTGAFEYLPKPFDLDEAIAVVQKAIHRNINFKNQEDNQQSSQEGSKKGNEEGNQIDEYAQNTAQNKPQTDNPTTEHQVGSSVQTNNKKAKKLVNSSKKARQSKKTKTQHNTTGNPNGIIGQSPAMQTVFRAIGRLAHSPITVLITGESGTGKELIANALHQTSARHSQPFIALNMSAIPHDLIESELFGHEKGAFTGATSSRQGRFEQADGGTLFLDEIGDMPFNTQTRLLRVLANGEFFRVGGKDPIKVDVRIISATHQNLEGLVKQGKFREDLFYRLNVIRLPLPSLRQRREDIPALISHFLQKSAKELDSTEKKIDASAMQMMTHYDWYGNVRQLENACRWLTVMATGDTVYIDDLPPELLTAMEKTMGQGIEQTDFLGHSNQEKHLPSSVHQPALANHGYDSFQHSEGTVNNGDDNILYSNDSANRHRQSWQQGLELWTTQQLKKGEAELLNEALPEFERVMINTALRHCKGNKGKASKLLGWGRNTLTRKIQQLGLDDRW